VITFALWLLYPGVRAPGTHWIGGWVCPKNGLVDVLTLTVLEIRPLGRPVRSQLLYRLSYRGSCRRENKNKIDLEGTGWEGLDLIHLAQDRDE
jgi:hypothetical protein